MEDTMEVTHEEEKAIASLKRLAKRWPKSLWLYSGSGNLNVMRYGKDGKPVMTDGDCGRGGSGGFFDPDYSLDVIDIPNDGGDW